MGLKQYNPITPGQRGLVHPFKTYYYIKHQGRSYGPYSSYSSCMAAIRGAGISGAFCSTSKY